MSNSIWVWGESVNKGELAAPPTLSVSAWPYLFDQTWLRWNTANINNAPIAKINNASIAFVNLFHTADSVHIKQIKQINPKCFIVAMPDPTLDLVLSHTDWMNMYEQMRHANLIAGRTQHDCNIYGTLLNKPAEVLPSPVGPDNWFAQFRGLTKEDYLITLDHRFAPANTVNNVAIVAAIQRKIGCKVLYAAERPQTKEYAEHAGLKCDFLGDVPFKDFVELTARARLCVDMYTSHSFGRQGILCAEVGTEMIGSSWCTDVRQHNLDPFNIDLAVKWAAECWEFSYDSDYSKIRYSEYASMVERCFGFDASKARINKLVDRVNAEFSS